MNAAREFDAALVAFVRESGFIAQYVKVGSSTYDPSTGTNSESETVIPVQAMLSDLALHKDGLGTNFSTEIVQGDKLFYMRPPSKVSSLYQSFSIDPSCDRVRAHGIEYKIVTMKEVNPNGADPMLYILYIRR